ncbi:hypothetical protein BJV82DRAFT_664542 [Fennellomyces sp. T-0311]|nr:hypothetical protein BJV82DRAFT_664542 [Fennellomyces sp. T-0311]
MSSITASYTSTAENRTFEQPISTENGTIDGLTAAIKSMQSDINQYLTSRMAANNENMDTSKEELEQEEGEEEDDEEELPHGRCHATVVNGV